jgi:hypothetical protein
MKILSLLACLLITGCSWSKVAYQPQPVASKEEAVKLVERLLWEQSEDFRPNYVEVSPEWFRAGIDVTDSSKLGFRTLATSVTHNVRAVYYDNVERLQLYKRGEDFQVVLFNGSEELYQYNCVNEKKAKQFINAVQALR